MWIGRALITPSALHFSGAVIPRKPERRHQLLAHQRRNLQQKRALLRVRFLQDVMLVVEHVEQSAPVRTQSASRNSAPAKSSVTSSRASSEPAITTKSQKSSSVGRAEEFRCVDLAAAQLARYSSHLQSPAPDPVSAPLRRIPFTRTTAYCTYGPVSPSKLSASLKSKRNHRRAREAQQKIPQRADRHGVRDRSRVPLPLFPAAASPLPSARSASI